MFLLQGREMERPTLLCARDAPDGHLRIWRYEDGRYLFEIVGHAKKGITVFCPTFEKAQELWSHYETDQDEDPRHTD